MSLPDRRVITFYSYKGGVGRTMALANVAHRLAEKHGLRVVVVDWDLEAPGLHSFFGISPATAAGKRGVLDYFVAWRDAVTRNDPEPPPEVRNVASWLVPIVDDAHRPRAGSLSVLLAGQQDGAYDERLAGFHWQRFYVDAGGALAVERLREQLVKAADVVLIDSRTGLTDAGGICTIQIPDGVVLMTAPSAQSLEGTETVARTIAGAQARDRAARDPVRVWVALGRYSMVEETDLAERWLEEQRPWFERGVEQGLWLAGDHSEGLKSHMIPYRARWSFGEAILREGKVDLKEPLMMAYEELTGTLVRWLRSEVMPSLSPSPSTSQAVGASVVPQVSIARLPATSRELFGREAELAWLDACWVEGVRVATIVAWGGVGKSALVNAWLARMGADGWRGAARVYGWSFYSQGTDRLSSSDAFIDAALRWFEDPDPAQGSPWDKGERLAALVRKERTILVLDGLEPLQWGPGAEYGKLKDQAVQALVKELGAQNKGLCLITTRIAVTDLETPGGPHGVAALDLDHLSAEAGAELLAAQGARGTPEDLQDAAREYDGHSLALTLLGSYVRKAHKGDIRRREGIPPLAAKPAHRMMATYERWFGGKPELAVLRMLGLFNRPASVEEIAVLRARPSIVGLTDTLADVGEAGWNEAATILRDVGLLAGGEEADDRLDAHPLVREHFGEQLKREQPEAWREGHRRLYEHLRKTAKERPDTIEEMAPLYAAVVHGCQAGKRQEALDEIWWERIQRGGEAFSTRRLGAFGSEVAALSAFFDPPWERLAPGLAEQDQALVLNQAGFALRALGRLPEATGLLRLGLERLIARKSWKDAAVVASNLGELLQARGELNEALVVARQSVELADETRDVARRVRSRATLAAGLHATGLPEEAAAFFEEAERLQNERQPTSPQLYSLSGFRYCDLLLDQDRDAEVRERAAKTLVITERNHWLLDIALDHLSLGRAHILAAQRMPPGDLPAATWHLQQAVDGLRRAGQQDYLPLGLLARAALHTHAGAFPAARHDLDEGLSLAARCGFRLHLADAHLGHARLALAEATPAGARPHLAAARDIISSTGYHRRDAELSHLEAKLAGA